MKEQITAEEIEKLQDKWATEAAFIERLYGPDKPEANAIRHCIATLNALLHANDF